MIGAIEVYIHHRFKAAFGLINRIAGKIGAGIVYQYIRGAMMQAPVGKRIYLFLFRKVNSFYLDLTEGNKACISEAVSFNCSRFRAHKKRLYPQEANFIAIAFPIPLLAPVMIVFMNDLNLGWLIFLV